MYYQNSMAFLSFSSRSRENDGGWSTLRCYIEGNDFSPKIFLQLNILYFHLFTSCLFISRLFGLITLYHNYKTRKYKLHIQISVSEYLVELLRESKC